MLEKHCDHDCNQSHCPFAQDVHNPNRYVCLKCGIKREINNYPSGLGNFLLLLLSLFISFYLLTNYSQQNNLQEQQKSIYSSPSKKIHY
ncbi:MAG: hypothetical protein KME59_02140 [Trichormus sp. ATA11-4-KO1]|jgi:hypothetical protein|nr:hypothetical protein [Trichormus sp. ATA11-4-KO1]